jgi:hypothetical protein
MGGLWYIDMKSLGDYKERSADTKNAAAAIGDGNKESTSQESDLSVSFGGQEYISANRASKITGYNQDYVGQLARSGKIRSRQLGSRWYVDEQAIVRHKKEKDALLAAVQSESVGIRSVMQDAAAETMSSPLAAEEPPLLTYSSEALVAGPSIRGEEPIDLPIKRLEANSRYSSSNEAPGRIEGPTKTLVQVNQIPRKQPIPILRNPNSITSRFESIPTRRAATRVGRYNLPFALAGACSILIIGIAGYTYLVSGNGSSGHDSLAQEESTVENAALYALNKVMVSFEDLVSPGLDYQRK